MELRGNLAKGVEPTPKRPKSQLHYLYGTGEGASGVKLARWASPRREKKLVWKEWMDHYQNCSNPEAWNIAERSINQVLGLRRW